MFFVTQGALDYADERSSNNANTASSSSGNETSQGALIFLHTGTYRGEFLVIDSDISLIGNGVLFCVGV